MRSSSRSPSSSCTGWCRCEPESAVELLVTEKPSPPPLKKELRLRDLYAVSTGATLSAGFFLLPGIAAEEAGAALTAAQSEGRSQLVRGDGDEVRFHPIEALEFVVALLDAR